MKLVKVRVSGDAAAFAAVLDVLTAAAQVGMFEVAEVSALYPNRCDPGYRVYVTVAVPGDAGIGQRGAAHLAAVLDDVQNDPAMVNGRGANRQSGRAS